MTVNSTSCNEIMRYIYCIYIGKGTLWSKIVKKRFIVNDPLEKVLFEKIYTFRSLLSPEKRAFWLKIVIPFDSSYNLPYELIYNSYFIKLKKSILH